MEHSVFFAASDLVDLAKKTGETFGFNWPLFISQCVSFAIVCIALHRFAYKPIIKILEERRDKIAEGLANAEKIKQELANAQGKAREIIGEASAKGNKLIEEARQSAAKILEAESQKAIATANDIIAKARQAGDAEVTRLKADLRKEFGRLVVAVSAKVTGGILTPEQQNRLAEDTAKQLASN